MKKGGTEQYLMAKCDEAINKLTLYHTTLSRSDIQKHPAWLDSLSSKCQQIYRALKSDLGLPYEGRELTWLGLVDQEKKNALLSKLSEIIERIKELRARKQLEYESAAAEAQGEKEAGTPRKTIRLKLVSKTQETYWNGQRKERVTETEFYALWLLATVPNSTVQSTILYELFKDSRGNADVYLSRLIRGREDRKSGFKYHFPEIESLIASQEKVGYYLKLPPEEIELVGNDPEDIEHLVVRLTST